MLKERPQFAQVLEFIYIDDLTSPGVFDDAVKDMDGVIHTASVSSISSIQLISLFFFFSNHTHFRYLSANSFIHN